MPAFGNDGQPMVLGDRDVGHPVLTSRDAFQLPGTN
jgi:hypothetical protein